MKLITFLKEERKRLVKSMIQVVLVSSVLVGTAYAATAPSSSPIVIPTLDQALKNLSLTSDSLMRLVTAIAYVMGFFFVIQGLFELKHYGDARTMMSHEHTLKKPLLYLIAGAALIYLPASIHTGISTFWNESSPLAYIPKSADDPWQELVKSCFVIIQLIGVIAFIRGLILLTHLSGNHGGQNSFGKAMAHIVGGILCINMYQFLQTIFNTLVPGTNI